jgi:hypothetical protein
MSTEVRLKRAIRTFLKCVLGKFKLFSQNQSKKSFAKCLAWEYFFYDKVCKRYHDSGEGGCCRKRKKIDPTPLENLFPWFGVRRSKPWRNDVPLTSKLFEGIKVVITYINRSTGFNLLDSNAGVNIALGEMDSFRLNRSDDGIR